ncbi:MULTISPECIES: nicotinamide riboside transporter PnuC [unclassified Arenibacter]|uniref:nicotinamide riboside transporter PnuC n=1 Tax=unclassified Arenibacter TaxID=2615047 RepID=UPI000E346DDD|nr:MULTISPECIES: nicotinamide riboside transporter PnuC [unclassified Arenibacter]MCM4163883.1 nicotinamide mononucleotide transporter [Arenibacter sp. A80]RFT56590.1 nicotinamide riboside transporter PnuC [Arenibacter sp. P308M17]
MSPIFDWIFAQYQDTPYHLIILEMVGVFFGFLSVWYSMRENILVFPTGIISTGLFVYILFIFGLLGDMLINAYYFLMSVYGWFMWTRKVDGSHFIPITTTTAKEKLWTVVLFVATILFVVLVYVIFDTLDNWTAYIDTFTTAVFFVGMWLMAKKKLENWVYWIIGDVISVPLYFYKGLIFTSLQYLLFTIIAIFGYLAWKKSLDKNPQV